MGDDDEIFRLRQVENDARDAAAKAKEDFKRSNKVRCLLTCHDLFHRQYLCCFCLCYSGVVGVVGL